MPDLAVQTLNCCLLSCSMSITECYHYWVHVKNSQFLAISSASCTLISWMFCVYLSAVPLPPSLLGTKTSMTFFGATVTFNMANVFVFEAWCCPAFQDVQIFYYGCAYGFLHYIFCQWGDMFFFFFLIK